MDHAEFEIGTEFRCGGGRFRCTEIGTRTIVAIRIEGVAATLRDAEGRVSTETFGMDRADAEGWSKGPPYAVSETVFDEDDMQGCERAA